MPRGVATSTADAENNAGKGFHVLLSAGRGNLTYSLGLRHCWCLCPSTKSRSCLDLMYGIRCCEILYHDIDIDVYRGILFDSGANMSYISTVKTEENEFYQPTTMVGAANGTSYHVVGLYSGSKEDQEAISRVIIVTSVQRNLTKGRIAVVSCHSRSREWIRPILTPN